MHVSLFGIIKILEEVKRLSLHLLQKAGLQVDGDL